MIELGKENLKEENVQEEIVLLKKGIESTITEEEQNGPTIPMVVFVLDVSGSMGTTTTVTSSDGMMVPTGYDKEINCKDHWEVYPQ